MEMFLLYKTHENASMPSSPIVKVRVYAVGPDVKKWSWASNLPEQYITNNIVRVYSADGTEGVGGAVSAAVNQYDTSIAELLRPAARSLIGLTPFQREVMLAAIDDRNLLVSPQAVGALDVAMWDLAGRQTELPVYELLGGRRSRIQSYASTPMLDGPDAYVRFVGQLIKDGFKAVKMHCWCDYHRDREMVLALHNAYGQSQVKFMLDVEQRYSREDALKMATLLCELGYEWFEAPLRDTDLDGYADLRRRTDVPILCSGNYILDPAIMNLAIDKGAWSSVRCETTFAGGITGTSKIFAIAAARGMNVEPQTWGYSLTQAAGLHVELAFSNCRFFEQPVPYPAYEFGCLNPIRTDSEGFVSAPVGPGLGIQMDWDLVEESSLLIYEDDGKMSRNLKAAG
jgi:L-alanine-DL-glutamate epimerase-like enolase superfamily enzyme